MKKKHKVSAQSYNDENMLSLKNVSKTFTLSEFPIDSLKQKLFTLFQKQNIRSFKALDNINIDIKKGETIGIIGRNGSGKSTLTKVMAGTYRPDKGGKVIRNGNMMLMNLGVGMSHELTAIENIYINGSALGLKKKKIDELVDEILEFAEIEEFANTKIKYFSTGMIQRLSFSIAVNAGADIIFLDEVFAVGDEKFKRKAIKVFEQSWLEGRTVVMVSHSLNNIQKYCDRAIYLKKGKMVFVGDVDKALELYHEDNKE
jgi:ABC-type polysaccharide/polyol phosphate transport system ATPase subunit